MMTRCSYTSQRSHVQDATFKEKSDYVNARKGTFWAPSFKTGVLALLQQFSGSTYKTLNPH